MPICALVVVGLSSFAPVTAQISTDSIFPAKTWQYVAQPFRAAK